MPATKHAQEIKNDSKEYLTTALFQILKNKSLEEIKITELVKRAGVSRMAFYRNYNTLEEILIAYFEPKIATLFEAVILQIPSSQKMEELQFFFSEFSTALSLAIKRNYEYIIQGIFHRHMLLFYAKNTDWRCIPPMQLNYWSQFMSAGVYAIWREWFLNRQGESLEEIHELIATFQNATMQALLKEDHKKECDS
ncbi:MAG TPA: TetR/AcrR family transcriptional regulator [Ruminococcaceae bacterium]|nr:TetR/AcrR family transcriptional regulator [Oscillospiraceae bacterium]